MVSKHLRPCLIAALALVALAGCSGGGDTNGKLVVENRLAPPAEQVLRRSNFAEPDTLDPARSDYNYSAFILLDMYEGLTNLDARGRAVPGVAKSWVVSADGKTYTFHLRGDARWSNGEPVTADDFVFAMRRALAPRTAAALADLLSPLLHARAILAGRLPPAQLGVSAPDPHTLVIRLRSPTPYLPTLLANPIAFPVYRPALKRWGNRFTRPGHSVSNGAYRLSEWVVNDHVTLLRNRQYWDDAHTHINKVIYYPIGSADALKRFRAGDLDFTYQVPTREVGWIQKHMPQVLVTQPYSGVVKFAFNLLRVPFKDATGLRRALSMAIDRRIITDKIMRGGQQPAYSFVPPMPGYPSLQPAWASWPAARRLREARRLYQTAGYSAAHPLAVQISFPTDQNNQRIAEAIAAMWRENLGVQAQLMNKEAKVNLEDAHLRKVTQYVFDSWVADYLDPYDFLQMFLSHSADNFSGYANPRYDALLENSQQEPDPQRREHLMAEAERLLFVDQPAMPIYYYTRTRLIERYVKGVKPNPLDYHYTRELYILAHHREPH